MNSNSHLMEMLVGYASAHQHPFNVAVHLVGIPVIMLGVFVPLSMLGFDAFGIRVNFAYIAAIGLFAFYMTLDHWFSFAFLAYALPVAWLATGIGNGPTTNAWILAGATFVGGYIAQFIGHAVEKSVPVLLKHPIQANLAAPFFTVVEIFGLLGLREHLFDEVQREVALAREQQTA